MDIDIRKSIINNFENSNVDEIKKTIEEYDNINIIKAAIDCFLLFFINSALGISFVAPKDVIQTSKLLKLFS